jgi:hypothetical protein
MSWCNCGCNSARARRSVNRRESTHENDQSTRREPVATPSHSRIRPSHRTTKTALRDDRRDPTRREPSTAAPHRRSRRAPRPRNQHRRDPPRRLHERRDTRQHDQSRLAKPARPPCHRRHRHDPAQPSPSPRLRRVRTGPCGRASRCSRLEAELRDAANPAYRTGSVSALLGPGRGRSTSVPRSRRLCGSRPARLRDIGRSRCLRRIAGRRRRNAPTSRRRVSLP